MTRAVSLVLSLTPNWMSSLPKNSALPPRSTAAVSALSRVRVLLFENSKAIDLLKSDCEGMRSFSVFTPGCWGESHGSEMCLR